MGVMCRTSVNASSSVRNMTDTADTVRTGDKLLSITEAAEACSLSRQTAEGAFPGAHREVMAAAPPARRTLGVPFYLKAE